MTYRAPDGRSPEARGDREQAAARREAHVGRDHEPAAIDGVGEGAAHERGQQQRPELGQPQEADRERRMGQRVHLVRQGDVGDHAAQKRHELGGVEQPVVAVPAKRGEVHRAEKERTRPLRNAVDGARERGLTGSLTPA